MSPPPRRLSFAVGTSLLSASLSLGATACDDDKPTSNPGPVEKQAPPEDNVNVRSDPSLELPPEPKPTEPEPEPVHVNEGPEPLPEPEPDNVNVRPDTELEPPPEPKRVNVRHPND